MATIDPIEVPVILKTRPDLDNLKAGVELMSRLYLQNRRPRKADFQTISDACTALEDLEKLPMRELNEARLRSALEKMVSSVEANCDVIYWEEELAEARAALESSSSP